MIYDKYAQLKYMYGNRYFWFRGYYISTVGREKRVSEAYIRNQMQEDYAWDQISINGPVYRSAGVKKPDTSPFRGS